MTEENKGPGNGAGDWIHAWVEQQREQLRRASSPGAQSADKAPGADAMRDMSMKWGMQWLEAGQSYLQAWMGAASAGEGATRQFADLLARMPTLGLAREQSESWRELMAAQAECQALEQEFAQVAHSESYAKLQAQVGNAAIKLRARQQAVIERGLKYFDLPTRAELNTVHKQMRELRERIATLEAQLAAQSDSGRERE
jgi:hypothetical protein